MATKETSLGKLEKIDRLKVVMQSITKRVNDLGSGLKVKDPDADELGALMSKANKPAEFFLVFDLKKLKLEVRAGGKSLDLGSADFTAVKDVEKRRALLHTLYANDLVEKAVVEAFDKANPTKETLDRIAELEREVAAIDGQIANIKKLAASRKKKFEDMPAGEQEVGFVHWAERKNWDRYPHFLNDLSNGRDAAYLYETYISPDAKEKLALKDPMREAIKKALDEKHKPDFEPIHKLVAQTVNGIMMPQYVKDTQAGLAKQLKEWMDRRKKPADELAKLKGK